MTVDTSSIAQQKNVAANGAQAIKANMAVPLSNGVANGTHKHSEPGFKQQRRPSDLLEKFIAQFNELEAHK